MTIGTPNTGKSTIFNALTKKRQHTGNWAGKTVALEVGGYAYNGVVYDVADLPGAYSTEDRGGASADERAACDFLRGCSADLIVLVLDATALSRGLPLALELCRHKIIICVNLIDEAKKRGIEIDTEKLSEIFDTEVISANARENIGIEELKQAIERNCKFQKTRTPAEFSAEEICERVCKTPPCSDKTDRRGDNALLGGRFGIPVTIAAFLCVLWLTLVGAGFLSDILLKFFYVVKSQIYMFLLYAGVSEVVREFLSDGVFNTTFWVVSVMLPGIAIFFPLFALLEDYGLLPRFAFNLDSCFRKAGTSGKQALTMCMGLGCNCAGVSCCRIIENERERLIAILTNNFTPCNGRFPLLFTLSAIFFGAGAFAPSLFALMGASLCIGLGVTFLLSKILRGGEKSVFALELPPYRKPLFGRVILRSLRDKTLTILLRAVTFSAPAGAFVWILQNTGVLPKIMGLLDPFGRFLGMDGVILAAFILGLPANEIVIPIMLMCYLQSSALTDIGGLDALSGILRANGWNAVTAVCVILFSLNHFPCATTLWTIKKETNWRVACAAFLIPTAVGCVLCSLVARVMILLP
ncbi:iron transporter FeoB [Clostridia bacterium]|nr:iron transporter FeoB [Clostridia bacterium]